MENTKTKLKQKEKTEMREDSIDVDSASARSDCSMASGYLRRLSKAHKRPRPESWERDRRAHKSRGDRRKQIAKKQADLLLAEGVPDMGSTASLSVFSPRKGLVPPERHRHVARRR
ncbi:unnamed protein product [Euphydryas editha]|uniref:Uncharacterized protein n=1 Tax=Euphydryas editha TaxID=104508 RepID=A0AAU9V6A4_EUPED|nr:unnamed protein product [Euphydryas editha]